MKKKIIIILALVLAFISIVPSNAMAYEISENNIYKSEAAICQERAELFLQNIGHPAIVSNPLKLNNLENEVEAILFTINENGYIIVNVNDYSIPELSFYKPSPFSNCDNPVYNGPLEYYYEQDGQIKSIIDNATINVEQRGVYYTRQKIDNPQEYLASLYSTYQTDNVYAATVEKYLKGTLKKWYISGGKCGSIASAICMRYYYDYVSTAYVNSNNISQDSLIAVMQGYVGTGATTYTSMVNGLNSYFKSRSVNNTAVKVVPLSFSRIKQSIIANRPIIISTYKHPTYTDHWVIAHGYFESRVDGNYIIVNDGWGSNNVWIEPNTTTLDGTIHFAN